MTTSIHNFKKRKSFISIISKSTHGEKYSEIGPISVMNIMMEPAWNSLVLDKGDLTHRSS